MVRADRFACAAFAALLLTTPGAVSAQTTSVTLADALRRAEAVTPGVVQAVGARRSAYLAVRNARWQFVPQITFRPQAQLQLNSGQSRVDPITGQIISGNTSNPSYGMSINGSLPLFDGFSRNHALRAAKAREVAADANITTARFGSNLAVTNAFFDALANRELLRVQEEAVKSAEQQLRNATARLQSGAAQRGDSLTALVQLGQARQSLLNAQAALATAEANLARLIGVDGRAQATDDPAFRATPGGLDTMSLRSELKTRAPAVVASEANLDAAKAQLKQNKSGYWPVLDVTSNVVWNANKRNDYTLENTRGLTIGLNFNPWTNFTRETQVENQEISVRNAEVSLADQKRQLDAQLTQQLAALANAREAIAVATTSVEASTENVRVATERYRLGVTTIVELLQIQQQLTQAQVNEVQARFQYMRAKAQIESLIGRKLD